MNVIDGNLTQPASERVNRCDRLQKISFEHPACAIERSRASAEVMQWYAQQFLAGNYTFRSDERKTESPA